MFGPPNKRGSPSFKKAHKHKSGVRGDPFIPIKIQKGRGPLRLVWKLKSKRLNNWVTNGIISEVGGPQYGPPKYDSPYFRDPQKVPLILRNPQILASVTAGLGLNTNSFLASSIYLLEKPLKPKPYSQDPKP